MWIWILAAGLFALLMLGWSLLVSANLTIFRSRIDSFFQGLVPRIQKRNVLLKRMSDYAAARGFSPGEDCIDVLVNANCDDFDALRNAMIRANSVREELDTFLEIDPAVAGAGTMKNYITEDNQLREEIESGVGAYDELAYIYDKTLTAFPGVLVATIRKMRKYKLFVSKND